MLSARPVLTAHCRLGAGAVVISGCIPGAGAVVITLCIPRGRPVVAAICARWPMMITVPQTGSHSYRGRQRHHTDCAHQH